MTRPARLLILLNHTLTDAQVDDARQHLGIATCHYPPAEVQARWQQVPAEVDTVGPHVQPCLDWLGAEGQPGDVVLVQGDFGATYCVVQFCRARSLVPVYATSERAVREVAQPDGSVRSERTFRHVRFRAYAS